MLINKENALRSMVEIVTARKAKVNSAFMQELRKLEIELNFIKNNKREVDYSEIFGKAQVICLCEIHTYISYKDEVISNLAEFKRAGATHVAFEMLPENKQDVIDQYAKGEANKEEVRDLLSDWKTHGHRAVDKYLEMVDACKSAGMKVIGVGRSYSEELDSTELVHKRNNDWAFTINDVLEAEKSSKVVLFCGQAHCGYGDCDRELYGDGMQKDQVNEVLTTRYGKSSVVVDFIGGCAKEDLYITAEESAVVKKAGISDKRFMLDIRDAGEARPADYLIHLPSPMIDPIITMTVPIYICIRNMSL
jgi:hypothetical protein